MNWFYESGGSQQGPVSEAELDRLLAEGKITQDTLVWREGMAGWMPHRTARPVPAAEPDLDLEVTRPASPAAASPIFPAAGASLGSSPETLPGGGGGSETPQLGWIRCSYTGRFFPPSEIVYIEGRPYSAAAKPQVLASLTSGQALPGLAGERTGPPWEDRERLGLWKALIDTIKVVLLQPAQCFATMRRDGGLGSPLFFWGLTAGIGMAIGQGYGVLLQGAMMGIASSAGAAQGQLGPLGVQAAVGAFSIVLYPLMMLVALFVQAGITHLMLMALKAANQPFETTFRVLAYGFGATGALHLIPICGSMVAGLWGLVAVCIGLGPAQNTTTGKGVAAVLLPVLICCVVFGGIYALFVGAIFAAAGASAGR